MHLLCIVVAVHCPHCRFGAAASELPSTFGSLKATHQKELISVAVLLRYGGAFVDASSVLAKGLDQLWKSAPPGRYPIATHNLISPINDTK